MHNPNNFAKFASEINGATVTAPTETYLEVIPDIELRLCRGLLFLMEISKEIPPYKNLSLEDMDGEIWKDVVGTDGAYSVSNLGRVRSNERQCSTWLSKRGKESSRLVKSHICKQNVVMFYFKVSISYPNGQKKAVNVHRLVAEAFISNIYHQKCINHKDENKLNNRVDNLEFCDYAYNNNYGTRNARISKTQRNAPSKSKRILQMSLCGDPIKKWDSICEAGRAGFDRKRISRCCRNMAHYNTCGGFKWKYI